MNCLSSRFEVRSLKLGLTGLLAGFGNHNLFAQPQSQNSGALVVPAPSPDETNAVEATLRDIKAPVHIPDYVLWLCIIGGILLLALIGFLLWKFWLKKKFEPVPTPPAPPHVRARRKLNEATLYINDPKHFTVFVSDTIRVYLEESFNLRAPERTTEEFLYELQSSGRLDANVKQSLGEFLSRCDLVKFAKYEPTQAELEELLKVAYRVVEETEPRATTPAPPLDTRPSTLDAQK